MQHDEVIWQVINHGHCSFKAKLETQSFCRNEYNVTGLCNRSSCPLANSRYATIREHQGRLYLYLKTIERAHTPKNMWQRIRLKRQYAAALEQVDQHLAFWPKFLVHKNKQRLTKITQYLIRMRKLALKARPKLTTMPARKERNERRREAKAEVAAKLDTAIEAQLLDRLRAGTYGQQDILNYPAQAYEKALAAEAEREGAVQEAEEYIEGDEDSQDEEEEEDEEEVEYLDDDEVDLQASEDDMEDYAESDEELEAGPSSSEDEEEGADDPQQAGGARKRPPRLPPAARKRGAAAAAASDGKGKRRRGARLEIEYEREEDRDLLPAQRTMSF